MARHKIRRNVIHAREDREARRPIAARPDPMPVRPGLRAQNRNDEDGRTIFRSVEEQYAARISPYSNFEGGWEPDARHDVDRDRSVERPDAPSMTRAVKPYSGNRAQ